MNALKHCMSKFITNGCSGADAVGRKHQNKSRGLKDFIHFADSSIDYCDFLFTMSPEVL
jgi:hypothetical protein